MSEQEANDREAARVRVARWIDKPEHKGKPEDHESTRNDGLNDPKHNEGKDE